MWTKELTNRLEELGYDWEIIEDNGTYIYIYDYITPDPDYELAIVRVDKAYIFDTNMYKFLKIGEQQQKELHKLLAEYSSTPEDEREDPNKKYTYKHKYLKTKHGDDTYLAIGYMPSNPKYYPDLVDEAEDTENYQALFTNTEIEKYNKELGIDLDNYIKEEAPTKESNDTKYWRKQGIKKMKDLYYVTIWFQGADAYEVEAESQEEAEKKALEILRKKIPNLQNTMMLSESKTEALEWEKFRRGLEKRLENEHGR